MLQSESISNGISSKGEHMKNRPGLKQYIFAALGVVILVACPRESKSSEFPVTPVTCHPEASYFRNGNQRLTVQKSETYDEKVSSL